MQNPISELEKNLIKLNSTTQGRRAFLVALPVLINSCSSLVTGDRNREGDNSGQVAALTPQQEQKMAKEYLPQMQKDYPPHKSAYAQSYINNLGQKIVQRNALNANPYTYSFTVVDSKAINAFALPAGTVFVTAPLIKLASNEAELAGVLGHEIGHVKARHAAERMQAAESQQSKSILFGLGGALLGGAAGFGLGKLLCSNKQDKECLKRAAMYGGLAGGAGGLLIQKYAFMANSREDEMEADRIGFRTSLNSGYDKNHIGGFYTKLFSMEQKAKGASGNTLLASLADAMSTHPPSKERVIQMQQMAHSSGKGGVIDSAEFQKLQKKALF